MSDASAITVKDLPSAPIAMDTSKSENINNKKEEDVGHQTRKGARNWLDRSVKMLGKRATVFRFRRAALYVKREYDYVRRWLSYRDPDYRLGPGRSSGSRLGSGIENPVG